MGSDRRVVYACTLRTTSTRFERLAGLPNGSPLAAIPYIDAATAIWGAYHDGFLAIPAIGIQIGRIYASGWSSTLVDPSCELWEREHVSTTLFHGVAQGFCQRVGPCLFPDIAQYACDMARKYKEMACREFDLHEVEDNSRVCELLAEVICNKTAINYIDRETCGSLCDEFAETIRIFLEHGSEAITSQHAHMIEVGCATLCYFKPESETFRQFINILQGDNSNCLDASKKQFEDYLKLFHARRSCDNALQAETDGVLDASQYHYPGPNWVTVRSVEYKEKLGYTYPSARARRGENLNDTIQLQCGNKLGRLPNGVVWIAVKSEKRLHYCYWEPSLPQKRRR